MINLVDMSPDDVPDHLLGDYIKAKNQQISQLEQQLDRVREEGEAELLRIRLARQSRIDKLTKLVDAASKDTARKRAKYEKLKQTFFDKYGYYP